VDSPPTHFLDKMASQSRAMPVLLLAALCAVVLRNLWAPVEQTFVAPQQSVHQGCRALSSGSALAAGAASAIVSTVPARDGVAAHFKVTLETPDGTQSFECSEEINVLDQAEEEDGVTCQAAC
jgi:hypothetical protein